MRNVFSHFVASLLAKCFVLFAFAVILFSCANNQKQEADDSPLPVRMAPVTMRETAEEINAFGSLSFLKKFELVSSLDGILDVLHFREGDRINSGDVVGILNNPQVVLAARRSEDAYSQALAAFELSLARLREGQFSIEARLLENERFQKELVQAKRILEEERRKNQNREALYAAGGLSDEAIREDRFRLVSAEAQLLIMEKELQVRRVGLRVEDIISAGIPVPADEEELRKAIIHIATSSLRAETAAASANLEAASREMESSRLMEAELTLKSPGQGVVGARYVEAGERIKINDRILTIMETSALYAVFPVPESQAYMLKEGMYASVVSGVNETYKGRVDSISPQADNQSFTFMVRVLFVPEENSPLKPGMFASVSIALEEPRRILVIPEAALITKRENSGRVFVVSGNVLSERNVILGSLMGDEREIVSGLALGEVVALGSRTALKEGLYVSPAE